MFRPTRLSAVLVLGLMIPTGLAFCAEAGETGKGGGDSPQLGITAHEPIYFSVGFNEFTNARFQFSLKFRPLGPQDDSQEGDGWWEDLYGAFTQTSVWDLESESKPFFDSSYRPSLFWYRHSISSSLAGANLGLAGGFEHESNGKGGTDSRSINLLFVRPIFTWGDSGAWRVTFSPKLYLYIEKSDNPDIQEFRGYGDYQFAVEHPNSWKVAATLRIGTAGHASILVDAAYPLRHLAKFFHFGYLHLQYFNGYGETLRNYDSLGPWQIRAGLMIAR